MTAKSILIVGGNGFVGSHLTDAFLKKGWGVRIADRGPDRFRSAGSPAVVKTGDYGNKAFISDALQGIDTVVHLVSTTVPGTSNDNFAYDVESNLLPTLTLLEAMREQGCKRIVYFSSGGTVYGNPVLIPTPEETPLKPICSYGVVKVAIENYIQLYSHLHGFQSLILRPSNLYGNRQGHAGVQGLINTLMERMAHDQEITIWGNGGNVRDYIFIDDMVQLVCTCLEQEATGVYNAGSSKGHSVNDIIEAISRVAGKKPRIRYSAPRSFDVEKIILDANKARNELGWQSTTSLEEGIQKMWNQRTA